MVNEVGQGSVSQESWHISGVLRILGETYEM
jgi:hypothetical protein